MKLFAAILVTLFSASSMLHAASQPDFNLITWTNSYQQKSIVKTLGVSSFDNRNPKKIGLNCVLIPNAGPTIANMKTCAQPIVDPAHFARISAAYTSYMDDHKNLDKFKNLSQTLDELGYPSKEFIGDEGKEEESVQGPEAD